MSKDWSIIATKSYDVPGRYGVLVRVGKWPRYEYYFIGTAIFEDTGQVETLAYPANKKGEILDYRDVAGGVGWNVHLTINELVGYQPKRDPGERQAEWMAARLERDAQQRERDKDKEEE